MDELQSRSETKSPNAAHFQLPVGDASDIGAEDRASLVAEPSSARPNRRLPNRFEMLRRPPSQLQRHLVDLHSHHGLLSDETGRCRSVETNLSIASGRSMISPRHVGVTTSHAQHFLR